eukprot:239528-Prorocentrum_lima.AAC.1
MRRVGSLQPWRSVAVGHVLCNNSARQGICSLPGPVGPPVAHASSLVLGHTKLALTCPRLFSALRHGAAVGAEIVCLRPLATRFRRANLQWVGTEVLATRTVLFGDHTPPPLR